MTLRLDYETLVESVIERAGREPRRPALVLVAEDDSEQTLTASQLLESAAAHACALRSVGLGPGDLVILVMRHSRELLSAFWGTLYLGAIPSIFPFLSEKLDPQLYMKQVRTLVAHSGARAVIALPEFIPMLTELLAGVDCRLLDSEHVAAGTGASSPPPSPPVSTEAVAFLQHSSGSTGLQKGVALSHRAVLNQVRSYSRAIALDESDVIVSWLPLYHDMGLIACCVMPIVAGVRLVLISPFHWVREPGVLFRAVQRHGGTLSWLPNFAYNHCARNVRERDLEGVDLRPWRVINCSEPVRYDSHRLFLERFGPAGLRETALGSCYAMAEATFAVTASPVEGPPRVDWIQLPALQAERRAVPAAAEQPGAIPMTSSGTPIEGVEVAVVGDDGRRLPDRRLGEIVVRGDCLFSGYHRRPDLDAKAIRNGWYHTGDIGYRAGDELYVTGRQDDLIIVGGKNVHPNDLEAIANEVPGIHPGRAVAFGVPDGQLGTQAVVMVGELAEETGPEGRRRIESELRRRIARQTEITLADVLLVDARWLLKTSSGKIARGANREKYLRRPR